MYESSTRLLTGETMPRVKRMFSSTMTAGLIRPASMWPFGLPRLSRRLDFRIEAISSHELPYFKWLVQTYVSGFYPETEDTYAEALALPSLAGHERFGRSTIARTVWAVKKHGNTLGFFVASEKRGGNVKLGPIVIASEFRREGNGTRVLRTLAAHYSRLGYGKLYMTIPATNLAACALAIKADFCLEATLRQHYSVSHDELVFGRCFGSETVSVVRHRPESPIEPFSKGALVSPFPNTAARVFHTLTSGKEALIGSSSKRGGAVKLVPIGVPPLNMLELLEEAESIHMGDKRKTFALLSLSDIDWREAFMAKNYCIEGRLVQPDRRDILVLSKGSE